MRTELATFKIGGRRIKITESSENGNLSHVCHQTTDIIKTYIILAQVSENTELGRPLILKNVNFTSSVLSP